MRTASSAGDDGHAQALTTVRLGLFGGTFDPPHVGHLLAASDAFEALHLDRVVFIPAASQPFKQGAVTASPADRLAMLRLSVGDDPRFAVDPIEIERGGLSYTVDTLEALRTRDPNAERFLLIGDDLARQIATWRQSERIAQLATIAVLARGADMGAGDSTMPLVRVATRRVDVSSSEIRTRVKAGLPLTGFVTRDVADYIRSAALYR